MKKYKIPRKHIREMIRRAVSAARISGKEICGLIIDNGYFLDLIKLNNMTKKGGSFSFYSHELKLVKSVVKIMSYKIVGTFHSHPTYIAEPGESDMRYAEDNSLMLIIDVMDKTFELWHIKNAKKRKIKTELI